MNRFKALTSHHQEMCDHMPFKSLVIYYHLLLCQWLKNCLSPCTLSSYEFGLRTILPFVICPYEWNVHGMDGKLQASFVTC